MYRNHRGMTVYAWNNIHPDERPSSYCPECNGEFIARRGEQRRWHWAHKVATTSGGVCTVEDSDWELRWKAVFIQRGWLIEVPVVVDGERFYLDAMSENGRGIFEFVHSLSASYQHKHCVLKHTMANITWVLDGDAFASEHRRPIQPGNGSTGWKGLLQPIAKDLLLSVGGLVHFNNRLYEHWKDDIWYPTHRLSGALELCIQHKRVNLDEVFASNQKFLPPNPIELPLRTVKYKDQTFRSELDARWAVFFDELGIDWQYRNREFALEDGSVCIPTFCLPTFDQGMYALVYRKAPKIEKIRELVARHKIKIWICEAIPAVAAYTCIDYRDGDGVVSWTGIPNASSALGENRMFAEPGFENEDGSIDPGDYDIVESHVIDAAAAARSATFHTV
jgi:hypothetical protein